MEQEIDQVRMAQADRYRLDRMNCKIHDMVVDLWLDGYTAVQILMFCKDFFKGVPNAVEEAGILLRRLPEPPPQCRGCG